MKERRLKRKAKIETLKNYLPVIIIFCFLIILIIGIEVIILCKTNSIYLPMNIFQNIFGTISFKDSGLPNWAFVLNTIVGVIVNIFFLGVVFALLMEWRRKENL